MVVRINGKIIEEPNIDITIIFRKYKNDFIYPFDLDVMDRPTAGTNEILRFKIEFNLPDGKGVCTVDTKDVSDALWIAENLIIKECNICRRKYNRMLLSHELLY